MFGAIFFRRRFIAVFILPSMLLGLVISGTAYAKRSPEEVFKYQKHMAQAGYSSAIYKLAVMYQTGYGTPRNLKRALELYKESAKLGYKKAEPKISEVKIMIESGDFNAPKSDAKQKEALAKKRTEQEQQEIAEERRKLDADMEQLRQEKARIAKERKALIATKKQEAEDEMDALERSIELLMDDGTADE